MEQWATRHLMNECYSTSWVRQPEGENQPLFLCVPVIWRASDSSKLSQETNRLDLTNKGSVLPHGLENLVALQISVKRSFP